MFDPGHLPERPGSNAHRAKEYHAGGNFYHEANSYARAKAKEHGLHPRQVAGAVAALSPGTDWDRGIAQVNHLLAHHKEYVGTPTKDAARLYHATVSKGNPDGVVRNTKSNYDKAFNILRSVDDDHGVDKHLGGHKVRSFFNNIVDPHNRQGHDSVTMDRHAVSAAVGGTLGPGRLNSLFYGHSTYKDPETGEISKGRAKGSNKNNNAKGTYAHFASAYREAHRRLTDMGEDAGPTPAHFQAKVWGRWRKEVANNHKKKPEDRPIPHYAHADEKVFGKVIDPMGGPDLPDPDLSPDEHEEEYWDRYGGPDYEREPTGRDHERNEAQEWGGMEHEGRRHRGFLDHFLAGTHDHQSPAMDDPIGEGYGLDDEDTAKQAALWPMQTRHHLARGDDEFLFDAGMEKEAGGVLHAEVGDSMRSRCGEPLKRGGTASSSGPTRTCPECFNSPEVAGGESHNWRMSVNEPERPSIWHELGFHEAAIDTRGMEKEALGLLEHEDEDTSWEKNPLMHLWMHHPHGDVDYIQDASEMEPNPSWHEMQHHMMEPGHPHYHTHTAATENVRSTDTMGGAEGNETGDDSQYREDAEGNPEPSPWWQQQHSPDGPNPGSTGPLGFGEALDPEAESYSQQMGQSKADEKLLAPGPAISGMTMAPGWGFDSMASLHSADVHSTCLHCQRPITRQPDGSWVDPQAHGDDSIWRETCDSNHDSFRAEHEPHIGGDRERTSRPYRPDTEVPLHHLNSYHQAEMSRDEIDKYHEQTGTHTRRYPYTRYMQGRGHDPYDERVLGFDPQDKDHPALYRDLEPDHDRLRHTNGLDPDSSYYAYSRESCPNCHGERHDPSTGQSCAHCGGRGFVLGHEYPHEGAKQPDPRGWLLNGSGGGSGPSEADIAKQAKAHLAALSAAEQQELIKEGEAEGVRARNFDLLKLEGTHYLELEARLQAEEESAEDLFW
jgi:hypothetical protein